MNNVQKKIGLGSGKPTTTATYKYGKVEREDHKGEVYEIYFFFNDTETTEIYTLTLHDALPIYRIMELTLR